MRRKKKKLLNIAIKSGLKEIKKLKNRLPQLARESNALFNETKQRLKGTFTAAEAKASQQIALLKNMRNLAALRLESVKVRYGKLNRAK